MKIVKYKRPISDCVLCYVRIIAYTDIDDTGKYIPHIISSLY